MNRRLFLAAIAGAAVAKPAVETVTVVKPTGLISHGWGGAPFEFTDPAIENLMNEVVQRYVGTTLGQQKLQGERLADIAFIEGDQWPTRP